MLSIRQKLVWTAALTALWGPAVAQAAPAARVVTLITGDRVALDGAGNATIHRAPGRSSVQFTVSRVKDHLHVIPSDALAPLNAGKLDPRLLLKFQRRNRLQSMSPSTTAPLGKRPRSAAKARAGKHASNTRSTAVTCRCEQPR